MEQEHRLSYKAGITRKPSDFLCSDGELAECINLTTDTEELKPVVQPAEFITTYAGITGDHKPTFVYVHKVANQDNYIGYLPTDGNKLVIGTVENKVYSNIATYNNLFFVPGTSRITSIGKTLILTNTTGMHYLKWNGDTGAYKNLGNKIPEPHLKFWLEGGTEYFCPITGDLDWYLHSFGFEGDVELKYTATNSGRTNGVITDRGGSGAWIEKDADENYNDLIVGLYSKNKKAICEKKAFCEPFFIRYALRLYDDSLYYISNPILMFPSVTRNTYFWYDHVHERIVCFTKFCYLHYQMDIENSLEDFSDIVKDVDIFVSNGINIYDTIVQQHLLYAISDGFPTDIFDGVYHDHSTTPYNDHSEYRKESISLNDSWVHLTPPPSPLIAQRLDCLQLRDIDELKNSFKQQSLFYKICSVGLKPSSGNLNSKIDSHTLENLTTQELIEADDFFSRCKLFPETIFAYNSRINLANVARGFFEGYDFFMPYVTNGNLGGTYDFYVTIKTDQRTLTVKHTAQTDQIQGIYFYYPDSRASHVTITKGNVCVCDEDLEEHGGLHGALFFKGLPGVQVVDEPSTVAPTLPAPENDYTEQLANYIVTSEVNNPWVYLSEGYNKVGTGKIIGMAETTMALSQDAYGRNDLMVFSESGIWGMAVDRTGLYESIHPFTRDVCINPNSITKVDFGVFFVSKQGLMLATDQGVKCVSEQMNGVTFDTSVLSPLAEDTDWEGIVEVCQGDTSFLDYIRDQSCFLAYDYIDSRILIVNPNHGYQYIYNMMDGTISKTILPQTMSSCVASYPDNLLQGSSYVYSFYEKQREEEVVSRQVAFLLTRPMKLAGPVSQSSLQELMNVGTWDKAGGSTVKTEIYLSDNLKTWYPDISRFGAAARYYRLALFIKMLPTERLSGTILTSQERRGNNMR